MGATVKYVILLLNTEQARSMTEAEGQAWYAEIGAWYEKGGGGSGKLVEGGHQLAPPATAKTVRASGVVAARCDYSDQYKFQERRSDVPDAERDLVVLPSKDGRDAAVVRVCGRLATGLNSGIG